MDKITIIQAAMFAALCSQTKLSRSGYSIVFNEPQRGRHGPGERDARANQELSALVQRSVRRTKIRQVRILVTRKFMFRTRPCKDQPDHG